MLTGGDLLRSQPRPPPRDGAHASQANVTTTLTTERPGALRVAIDVRRASAPTVGPLLALLLTMAFFSVKSDNFLQAQNLSLVLQQVMVVGACSRSDRRS